MAGGGVSAPVGGKKQGWLIAGLGNPGAEYELTPHNLGFLAVDRLAARHSIRVTRKEAAARLLDITSRTFHDYERKARTIPHAVRLAMLFCERERAIAESLANRLQSGVHNSGSAQ